MSRPEILKAAEGTPNAAATKKADSFLENAADKIIRWSAHVGLTVADTAASVAGAALIGFSLSAIAAGQPDLAKEAFIRGVPLSSIGTMIGWNTGVKNTSPDEKRFFWTAKTAFAGLGIISTVIHPFLPAILGGISMATTLIGARRR